MEQIAEKTESFIKIITLFKSVDAPAGIDELLLARKERMAFGTDIYAQILFGRTCGDHSAASAFDFRLLVLGMNTLLHAFHLFQIRLFYDYTVFYHSAKKKASNFRKVFPETSPESTVFYPF